MKITDIITVEKPLSRKSGLFNKWIARLPGNNRFYGASQDEVLEKAVEFITVSLKGDYLPCVISHNGYYALVWREPCGLEQWGYSIKPLGENPTHMVTCGFSQRQEAIDAATRHLHDCFSEEKV